MSEEAQDTKPNVNEDVKSETHVNIKVSDGASEIFFKIKRNTPLKKLMEAFAKRQGKTLDSLRFLADGARVTPEQTPNELDLEDNDVIEVHQAQVCTDFPFYLSFSDLLILTMCFPSTDRPVVVN
ncbi:hypothetical protein WICPIJ_007301 [Wickerhamomyces pijperi]|uniref:Ubiquitin-like domain-containing protein n=1 Tax=Wickerhamomyces pijperi TaxID=599730 RepID=A0A9P8Q0T4_WICPI|nr:hypothetical protein WICPIJ_007301 [Wickerhamomyces pijperi]